MKVKINKLQNENNVKLHGLKPFEVGKTYDLEVVGYDIVHIGTYELTYLDGTRPSGTVYPCAYAVDENKEKYLICVELKKKKYSLFKDIYK